MLDKDSMPFRYKSQVRGAQEVYKFQGPSKLVN